ncbi:hypothetical protein HanPSC8_Chr03g0128891 [Helianthus annuus]|nr:hypothetical protein HanPSC8_Chr03g0128891 [Helianthus annuus]
MLHISEMDVCGNGCIYIGPKFEAVIAGQRVIFYCKLQIRRNQDWKWERENRGMWSERKKVSWIL